MIRRTQSPIVEGATYSAKDASGNCLSGHERGATAGAEIIIVGDLGGGKPAMWATSIPIVNDLFVPVQGSLPANKPDLIFLFEPSTSSGSGALTQLGDLFPGVPLVGCSTGTIVDGNTLSDRTAAAMAVGFDHATVKVATHIFEPQENSRSIGLALGQQLIGTDLVGIFVLSDGLQVNGSALVAGLIESVGEAVVISGGLAGDGARFEQTFVHANGECRSNLVAAIGFYGRSLRIAHGLGGGWDVFGPHRVITRSKDSVLYELDGKPALDLYEKYLGDEAKELPASALLYPLQIWEPGQPENKVVRTVLSIDPEARSMTLAGDIPQGWQARLMRGNLNHLVESATETAEIALQAFQKFDPELKPSLCLSVSCVGRRLLLGQRAEEEVQGVAAVLGTDVA